MIEYKQLSRRERPTECIESLIVPLTLRHQSVIAWPISRHAFSETQSSGPLVVKLRRSSRVEYFPAGPSR
jgi:hypothetical protein